MTAVSAHSRQEKVRAVRILEHLKKIVPGAGMILHYANPWECVVAVMLSTQCTEHILAAARVVKERFDWRVPSTMADLLTLPGVARKTANMVLGNCYGIVEGIAVDTHVTRLSKRLD